MSREGCDGDDDRMMYRWRDDVDGEMMMMMSFFFKCAALLNPHPGPALLLVCRDLVPNAADQNSGQTRHFPLSGRRINGNYASLV